MLQVPLTTYYHKPLGWAFSKSLLLLPITIPIDLITSPLRNVANIFIYYYYNKQYENKNIKLRNIVSIEPDRVSSKNNLKKSSIYLTAITAIAAIGATIYFKGNIVPHLKKPAVLISSFVTTSVLAYTISRKLKDLFTYFKVFFPSAYEMPELDSSKKVNHDHKKWLSEYITSDKNERTSKRIELFEQTNEAVVHGYEVDGSHVIIQRTETQKMQIDTKVIKESTGIDKSQPQITTPIKIKVVNQDTVDCANQLMQEEGFKNPVLLNMASDKNPGGGVTWGATAQEELLCLKSNLFLSLNPSSNRFLRKQLSEMSGGIKSCYTIPRRGAIYTPGVSFFRKSLSEGYKFCSQEKMSVISTAAYNFHDNKRKPKTADQYEEGMKAKIRTVMRVAEQNGHDVIVLGALGCGAYGNDPKIVSRYFQEVFSEEEFTHCENLEKIVFAVYSQQGNENFAIFRNELDGLEITK
jgi:uncharacterized protein (TIGR02452 family)